MKYSILFFIGISMFWGSCTPTIAKNDTSTTGDAQIVDSELPWSERLALSVIHQHPDVWTTENDIKPEWNYKIGLLMTAFEQLYDYTGKQKYHDYIKGYADLIIDENGVVTGYEMNTYNIDKVNSGKFVHTLYEKTGDERYLTVIQTLREQLKNHPRTNAGGFWHKKIYPYQMWLDGLYMGTPFYVRYTQEFEDGAGYDDIVHQFDEIQRHHVDEPTGLLYHAWDESKAMDWADKTTGQSPGFWARSLGWYAMAIVDVLDYLPADHPGHQRLISYLNDLSVAIVKVQDPSTGLWYNVPDRPDSEGNYLEASSSCMFVYALLKGVRKGYLPARYKADAKKAYDGITEHLIDVEDNGLVHVTQICKSAGLGGNPYRDGSYEYYISEPIKTDNLHGLGPFIMASIEREQI